MVFADYKFLNCCMMLSNDFSNILFKSEKVMLLFLIYLNSEDNGSKKFFGVHSIGSKNSATLGHHTYPSNELG